MSAKRARVQKLFGLENDRLEHILTFLHLSYASIKLTRRHYTPTMQMAGGLRFIRSISPPIQLHSSCIGKIMVLTD